MLALGRITVASSYCKRRAADGAAKAIRRNLARARAEDKNKIEKCAGRGAARRRTE